MGIEDGKPPVDEGGRKLPPPSSHAVRSVNARIQAGPVWMEIVHSDQLPRATSVASGWNRLLAWRRSVPTSRLVALGAVAGAVVTAVSLASSPYHLPKLPESVGVNKIVTTIGGDDSDGDRRGTDPVSTTAPSSQGTVPSAATIHKTVPSVRTTAPVAPISPSIVGVGSSTTPTATPTNTGSSTPTSSATPSDSTTAPTSTTTSASPTDTTVTTEAVVTPGP